MKGKYHPNPALNEGFHYQRELERHLERLKRAPESEAYLGALLDSVEQFREALKAGRATVPPEGIFSRHASADIRRCA
ncbi:hypothetical protein [Sedimenticola sp.]|uniref:hypothetical protein n=1 Tax=Sedimenticola sp. TaxID=1940285 RepID=UPI003D118B6E